MAAEWATEHLTLEHDLGHLNSGRPDIDQWLATQAVRLQRDSTCATYVWTDGQSPYVYGFYSLTPYRLKPDAQMKASGHTGGALSGYLIAKIGLHRQTAGETREVKQDDGETFEIPVPALLLLDAIVDMEHAAGTAGGRWAFIDTTNEPPWLLDELDGMGFKPINPEGSPIHFLRLHGSHSSIKSIT